MSGVLLIGQLSNQSVPVLEVSPCFIMILSEIYDDFLSHVAIFVLWFAVGLSSYYFLKKWNIMGSVQTPLSGRSKISDEKKKIVPFLRTCEKETSQPIHGKISGKIPVWLQGTLLRNGPGLMEIGEDKYQHAFDGLAMLHRFFIKDGTATYQNAFIRSDTYKKNMEANRIVVGAFGTAAFPDPCKTLYQRLMSHFSKEMSDDDNVNIIKIGDQYYAATETNVIRRVDPDTLETKEKVDISKFLAVNTATAHAHYERDGTVVNVGSCFTSGRPKYCIIKFPPNEVGRSSFDVASVLCRIPCRRLFYPSYYHSFAMSTNYCVFIEQSLVLSLPRFALNKLTTQSYGDTLQWCSDQMVYFHVVRKDSGEILPITFVAEPFMFFHQINTFEEEDHLVVDMCCYKDGEVVKNLYLSSLEESASNPKHSGWSLNAIQSEARRYVIPLKGVDGFENGSKVMKFNGRKASAVLQDDNSILCLHETFFDEDMRLVEMPRINYEKYSGEKYQYFYSICREKSDDCDALLKGDVVTGKYVVWKEENKVPSEPVFVASPDASSEDDGVVLSALLDKKDEKVVTLLINDAKTFQEIARVDFATSATVPNDFHGVFIS